jgi:hypothetical protein
VAREAQRINLLNKQAEMLTKPESEIPPEQAAALRTERLKEFYKSQPLAHRVTILNRLLDCLNADLDMWEKNVELMENDALSADMKFNDQLIAHEEASVLRSLAQVVLEHYRHFSSGNQIDWDDKQWEQNLRLIDAFVDRLITGMEESGLLDDIRAAMLVARVRRWPNAGGFLLADQVSRKLDGDIAYLIEKTASDGQPVSSLLPGSLKKMKGLIGSIHALREQMVARGEVTTYDLALKIMSMGEELADGLIMAHGTNEHFINRAFEIKEWVFMRDNLLLTDLTLISRMAVEIARFAHQAEEVLVEEEDKAMLATSLPEVLGGLNFFDNPEIKRVIEFNDTDPERIKTLEEFGDLAGHARNLKGLGRKAGFDGPVVYSSFGGSDPFTPFALAENAMDVVAMGNESFGSMDQIQSFFSTGSAFYRAGAWFDQADTASDLRVLMEDENLNGIGPLILARIISFMNGKISSIRFFDINDNAEIVFLDEGDAHGNNAVIEFDVEDGNAGWVKKRFWYIQHNIHSGRVYDNDLHQWGIDPTEIFVLRNKGYLDQEGNIQPKIVEMGFNTFRFNIGEKLKDARYIYKKLEDAYRQDLRFQEFVARLKVQAVLIGAEDQGHLRISGSEDDRASRILQAAERMISNLVKSDNAVILFRGEGNDFYDLSGIADGHQKIMAPLRSMVEELRQSVDVILGGHNNRSAGPLSGALVAREFRQRGPVFDFVLRHPESFSLSTASVARDAHRIYVMIGQAEGLTARERELSHEEADVWRMARLETFYKNQPITDWVGLLMELRDKLDTDLAFRERCLEWMKDNARFGLEEFDGDHFSREDTEVLADLAQAVLEQHRSFKLSKDMVMSDDQRDEELRLLKERVATLIHQVKMSGLTDNSDVLKLMLKASRWPYTGGFLLADKISRKFNGEEETVSNSAADYKAIKGWITKIRVLRRQAAFASGIEMTDIVRQIMKKSGDLADMLLKMPGVSEHLIDKSLEIADWVFENDNILFDATDPMRKMALEAAQFAYEAGQALGESSDNAVLASLTEQPVIDQTKFNSESADPLTKGGIDFTRNMLDLQIQRNDLGLLLPAAQQPMINMNVEGFLPVIINVTPVLAPFGLSDMDGQVNSSLHLSAIE